IVISVDENGHGKGSGRSLPGCSMMDALRANSSYLSKFGGHPMAAGLEIEEVSIESFREAMNRWVGDQIKAEVFEPCLNIDMQLPAGSLTEDLASELKKLEPFGKENESTVFAVSGLRLVGSPKFFGNNHIRFRVEGGNNQFNIVAFGQASEALPQSEFELAGHWEIDDFNNRPCFRALAWR